MIRFKLAELISDHSFRQGRRVGWGEVSDATGVLRSTLSKMINTRGYNATTHNIDALCKFFGCKVEDVMVFVPDTDETSPTPN